MPADNPDWTWISAANFRANRRRHEVIPPVAGVVQHYTASTAKAKALATWFAGKSIYKGEPVKAPMASAHLLIARDGSVIQQVAFDDEAFHAGEPDSKGMWMGKPQPCNVNWFTIGIENCNAGVVQKKDGVWRTRAGARYRGPAPQEAPDHAGIIRAWEPYTEELVQANVEVLRFILERYPKLVRENIQGHSDVAPHRKLDPGPLFPWEYILDEVFGTLPSVTHRATATFTPNDEDDEDDFEALSAARGNVHYDEDAEMCLEGPSGS